MFQIFFVQRKVPDFPRKNAIAERNRKINPYVRDLKLKFLRGPNEDL